MATWLSVSASHKPPDEDHHPHNLAKDMFNGLLKAPSRPQTPLSTKLRALNGASSQFAHAPDPEPTTEEDPQVLKFRALYEESEARIASLFGKTGDLVVPEKRKLPDSFTTDLPEILAPESQSTAPTAKKRKLDDDYDDYDDDEEDEDAETSISPLKGKPSKMHVIADRHASPVPRPIPPSRPSSEASKSEAAKQKEKPEDARKKLEETKRLETETVKNMSRQFFFTLENDRDAMVDQQRLDEAERRAEAEAEGLAKGQTLATQQGSLSSANLGASSLTLKNLIAAIDQHRPSVPATDSELRALMSEVRKNRSKWASEEKVGQEELYEAAEKVLNELKAQTEHSNPFLQPVKKKDAPDYFVVIRTPIDLGSMTKKLKQFAYKSKQDFVDDLHLIWSNCLKYNSAPEHPMRKHALFMRKETDKLVPLIPDIVIRDRAEMEAEERKQRIANGEFDDNAEDSDDDQPILASRGRKAPAKKTSKAPNAARKSSVVESTPNPDTKPSLSQINSMSNGFRADSEVDITSQGHSTPPPGILTPTGLEKGAGSVIDGASEMPDSEIPNVPFIGIPPEVEDDDYRLWKQRTKKERAMIAAARHRLFRGDKLNVDEEALLRSRSGMRRWQQMQPNTPGTQLTEADAKKPLPNQSGHTLAEGLEAEEESMLPDYYDPLAAIPDIDPRLQWENDTEGFVIEQNADFLRLYPSGRFIAPESKLSKRLADNMHRIQETRKIVSKIGVVKQMQLQTQIYQNQFTKYEPAPFLEEDVRNHVMTDDGPLMAPWVSKAALTRCIGQIFFHAGFEEFQPSAIDAIADIAGQFFHNLCSNLANYLGEEKISIPTSTATDVSQRKTTSSDKGVKAMMTSEEAILHVLHESGLSVNDLDYYAHEEMDRMAQRLQTMYDRMRSHYAELLKPAMTDDTAQGSGSFETGEQYTSGDFADDLGEDFFGFKELGLDKEFGLVNLSVPLHLLHNRLSTANQQTTTTGDASEKIFTPPPAFARVNVENVEQEIGLVREFFKKRLKENGDRPLPEDLDLPVKQRKGHGRPRVPATGKIGDGKALGASPQKKAPVQNKTANATASKLNLTNGTNVKDEKKKKLATPANGLANEMNGDKDATTIDDADNLGTNPPSPMPHINGGLSPVEPSQQDSQAQKTPLKPVLKRKPSGANNMKPDQESDGDALVNGDFSDMVNGMDSPPPSANGSGPEINSKLKSKGKNKGQDGDGDAAMISPESL